MHMTTLGASFLNRYRALRKNEGDRDLAIEIEYNFGRAFHGLGQFGITFAHRSNEMLIDTLELGVLNLAVKHYRQALGEVEASMGEAVQKSFVSMDKLIYENNRPRLFERNRPHEKRHTI
jgi:hypothetical protein